MSKKKKIKKSAKKFAKKIEKSEKKARKQRKKRGYADTDVWNMNSWFIQTVKPMLKQLSEQHQGFPAHIDYDWFDTHKDELGMAYNEWISWPSKEKDPAGYTLRSDANNECSDAWEKILERMVFLLGEMDEETCTRKNPYEKEIDKAYKEFHKKYGTFGEGLKTKKEKKKEKKKGSKRLYFPEDEPGREDIKKLFEKSRAEDVKIAKYRDKCKNEFFKIFSKYFWDLWD